MAQYHRTRVRETGTDLGALPVAVLVVGAHAGVAFQGRSLGTSQSQCGARSQIR